jgi:hypothetical protein
MAIELTAKLVHGPASGGLDDWIEFLSSNQTGPGELSGLEKRCGSRKRQSQKGHVELHLGSSGIGSRMNVVMFCETRGQTVRGGVE